MDELLAQLRRDVRQLAYATAHEILTAMLRDRHAAAAERALPQQPPRRIGRQRPRSTAPVASVRTERWTGPPPLSRRDVLDRLREHHRRGIDRTRAIKNHDPRLFEALLSHFGSLPRARRSAGLPPIDRASRWSRQRLVEELQGLHKAGLRVTRPELERLGRYDLIGAAHRLAGGLPQARRLAQLPEPRVATTNDAPHWSVDLVIDEILDRHARGDSLAMSRVPRPLYRAACQHCGSWQAAIEAAGLDYQAIRLRPPPRTEDDMIGALRELAERHPDWTRGDAHEHPSVRSARRAYGSLDAALEAAGIRGWPKVQAARLPDRDTALAHLRQRHQRGAPLNVAVVEREDSVLYRAIRRHFGSWDRGVRAAGLPLQRRIAPPWTPDEIIAELRARHARGAEMTAVAIEIDDKAFWEALRKKFGGFVQAARAAGVPFRFRGRVHVLDGDGSPTAS